jgi:hypothetical protein
MDRFDVTWQTIVFLGVIAVGLYAVRHRPPTPQRTNMAGSEAIGPIAKLCGTIAVVNFLAFLLIGAILGGYARQHVAGEPYYLVMYGHATEVSRHVYLYSRSHFYAMLSTHALGITSWLATRRGHRKRKNALSR